MVLHFMLVFEFCVLPKHVYKVLNFEYAICRIQPFSVDVSFRSMSNYLNSAVYYSSSLSEVAEVCHGNVSISW